MNFCGKKKNTPVYNRPQTPEVEPFEEYIEPSVGNKEQYEEERNFEGNIEFQTNDIEEERVEEVIEEKTIIKEEEHESEEELESNNPVCLVGNELSNNPVVLKNIIKNFETRYKCVSDERDSLLVELALLHHKDEKDIIISQLYRQCQALENEISLMKRCGPGKFATTSHVNPNDKTLLDQKIQRILRASLVNEKNTEKIEMGKLVEQRENYCDSDIGEAIVREEDVEEVKPTEEDEFGYISHYTQTRDISAKEVEKIENLRKSMTNTGKPAASPSNDTGDMSLGDLGAPTSAAILLESTPDYDEIPSSDKPTKKKSMKKDGIYVSSSQRLIGRK